MTSTSAGDLDRLPRLADNCDFKINQSGVLEFKSSPNYERPGDEGGDNSYNVVVQATDGDTGANPEDTRSWFKVTVNVADVEEVGKIRLHPRDPATDSRCRSASCHAVAAPGWGAHSLHRPDGWRWNLS